MNLMHFFQMATYHLFTDEKNQRDITGQLTGPPSLVN